MEQKTRFECAQDLFQQDPNQDTALECHRAMWAAYINGHLPFEIMADTRRILETFWDVHENRVPLLSN